MHAIRRSIAVAMMTALSSTPGAGVMAQSGNNNMLKPAKGEPIVIGHRERISLCRGMPPAREAFVVGSDKK